MIHMDGGISIKATRHVLCAVLIPLVLGIISSLVIVFAKVPALHFDRLEFLLNTIISCATTISGFILASVTILVGAASSEIMKKIRKHGALPELRWRYTETLILGLVVILYLTFLGAITGDCDYISSLHISISAGLLVSYTFSVISTCYYLLSIIGMINEETLITDSTPSSPPGEFR